MKFSTRTIIKTCFIIMVSCIMYTNSMSTDQVHQVVDTLGFNAGINQVVNRNAKIDVYDRPASNRVEPASNNLYMSSSNTSNAPQIGFLGKTAEIVQPHIVFHSNTPVSVVKQTPAHIGYRNEVQTINHVNKETGLIESHTHEQKIPIEGTINSVETVIKHDTTNYDLKTNTISAPKTTYSK